MVSQVGTCCGWRISHAQLCLCQASAFFMLDLERYRGLSWEMSVVECLMSRLCWDSARMYDRNGREELCGFMMFELKCTDIHGTQLAKSHALHSVLWVVRNNNRPCLLWGLATVGARPQWCTVVITERPHRAGDRHDTRRHRGEASFSADHTGTFWHVSVTYTSLFCYLLYIASRYIKTSVRNQ